ncbi:MAG: lysophospholipase [Oscillatoriales cyanobacterium CG2_30_44_21]|nr:MAG: lysophospholipase [Oscillatoriales cyanobacterium CG2_30_44_21]
MSYILFLQHGWADTCRDISHLSRSLADPQTITYAPDLGLLNTWLTITPLITKVEKIAAAAIATSDLPWRIVGHSMGGLIWLEILDRHPEWLPKVHSLVLVGSPVGGSDLSRLFDPWGWFPLIARDLATNRRPIAEAIASQVPTLSIVGDLGNSTDGTVPVGCSQFAHANFVSLNNLRHVALKNHPQVASAIQQFWQNPQIAAISTDTASILITKLRSLDLTEIDNLNFKHAQIYKTYADGTKLWTWKNLWQVTHVYVSAGQQCIYSAYASWQEQQKLAIALANC